MVSVSIWSIWGWNDLFFTSENPAGFDVEVVKSNAFWSIWFYLIFHNISLSESFHTAFIICLGTACSCEIIAKVLGQRKSSKLQLQKYNTKSKNQKSSVTSILPLSVYEWRLKSGVFVKSFTLKEDTKNKNMMFPTKFQTKMCTICGIIWTIFHKNII
jgi:hypothetical protein